MQANIPNMLAEVVCRYPEPLGVHPQVTYELAMQFLLKAHQLAAQVPFQFGYIDKPQEGSVYLVFLLPQQRVFPCDGIRYQEQETRYNVAVGGNREMEICESKFGFIPDSPDNAAFRMRRRFRLSKGGNPQLMVIHYTIGQSAPILPALRNQPVRAYPLRPLTEAPMFVHGERQGQRVPIQPRQPMPPTSAIPGMAAMGGSMQHQAAMLAQQNREMERLERRQGRERGSVQMGAHQQQHADDDSGDEIDHISTRSLALARYKRNHEYMNEVFMHAAFGEKKASEPQKPFACFKEEDMKEKVAKLEKDIQDLKESAETRRAEASQRDLNESASMDASMEGLRSAGSIEV